MALLEQGVRSDDEPEQTGGYYEVLPWNRISMLLDSTETELCRIDLRPTCCSKEKRSIVLTDCRLIQSSQQKRSKAMSSVFLRQIDGITFEYSDYHS